MRWEQTGSFPNTWVFWRRWPRLFGILQIVFSHNHSLVRGRVVFQAYFLRIQQNKLASIVSCDPVVSHEVTMVRKDPLAPIGGRLDRCAMVLLIRTFWMCSLVHWSVISSTGLICILSSSWNLMNVNDFFVWRVYDLLGFHINLALRFMYHTILLLLLWL